MHAPIRVLVVDDPVEAHDVACDLGDAGYVTASCADPDEALRQVSTFRPDAVITEMHLRGEQDGAGFGRRVSGSGQSVLVFAQRGGSCSGRTRRSGHSGGWWLPARWRPAERRADRTLTPARPDGAVRRAGGHRVGCRGVARGAGAVGPRVDPTAERVGVRDRAALITPVTARSLAQRAIWSARGRTGSMAPMNVVVCVKQIPDPAEPGKLEADNTLDRSGKLILDESDSYGVEMALQLADAAGGGEVTLVSMAPNGETGGLRTALAMGAAKAILVSDDALSGAGALDTAKVLAAAITRAEPDLVLAATESSDGYTGTVPEQVAALLGLTSVTFAKEIHIEGEGVKVQRQTELGYDEVEATLPALVSVTAGVVEPRYPSFKGIMAAKSKPVDQLTLGDLGIDAGSVGTAGAGQEIVSVEDAPAREAGEIIEDDGEAFGKIVAYLENLKVI
jgi:electron transfer flavoprotein beta subunit